MYATSRSNTLEDPERQNRKQAEFLVHREVPIAVFDRIGVSTPRAAQRVEGLLALHPGRHPPDVVVQLAWYY
ncbi:MAG: DarT ssDNA thymidine ADP-ribosyltransferase family protein [Planctomycetota bacterium]